LTRLGNALSGGPTGAFLYDDIAGVQYPVATSASTVAYLDGTSWTSLAYVSGTSNIPPSGGLNDLWFGTSVYLERRDLKIGVLTNGVNPLFAWGGPSDGTGYSTLTQGPIAKDVALLDNSVLAWNVRELSSTSRFVQRVQWPVGTDPEDWTGIGSGFEDLVDMRGEGTRIFTQGDDVILGSTQEIWIGRKIGGPFRFQFSPLLRDIGMPYARAALNTNYGIFFLGNDFMVYRIADRTVEPVGGTIQRELRDTIVGPQNAFLGYNPQVGAMTLYYSVTAGGGAQRAWTYHMGSKAWTPQRFAMPLAASLVGPTASAATLWNQLTGTIGSQLYTYNELLGTTGAEREMLFSSTGTAYAYDRSATSDDGNAVTHSVTLPLHADPFQLVHLGKARLRIAATSASSLSVGYSADGGLTVPVEQRLAISASSAVSWYDAWANIQARVPALRLSSTNGDWRVADVFIQGQIAGSQ
jgi:hypothetical protein